MFETLTARTTDSILTLMQAFRDDPRDDKIDLGVGIWREPDGTTPVFKAVKAAEQHLWRTQETKAYVGMLGDSAFHTAVAQLLFGQAPQRMAAAATVGGTSAVRQLLALTRVARPDATIWIPRQTWPNHWALAQDLGLSAQPYAWLDRAACVLDRDAVLRDLSGVQAGDVVILHACCHNPTGADPDPDLQAAILNVLQRNGAVPLIDAAYLGFADTPEADAGWIRQAAACLPEVLIAFSGSKSFGLYRERVGLAFVLSDHAGVVQSHLAVLNRMDFTFPPDHGARVVTEILNDADLRRSWTEELGSIRGTLRTSRQRLAQALRAELQSDLFDVLTDQVGMFALLPLDETRVAHLREVHGIYMVGDGRINLAGVTEETCPRIASALAEVMRGRG
ncbi:aromatic amino acid transaminase [Tropicimonas sp. S265A]|uniref:amino acid aminotransferase n=1 Tax=Tropicimonas sp. S265A TaxID=3415134 RepID=UPI003C7B564F